MGMHSASQYVLLGLLYYVASTLLFLDDWTIRSFGQFVWVTVALFLATYFAARKIGLAWLEYGVLANLYFAVNGLVWFYCIAVRPLAVISILFP